MNATIQKWGNSRGIRIPKYLLDALDFHDNERVELTPLEGENALKIRKISTERHRTLEERLCSFYGKDIEDIGRLTDEAEIDWGKRQGTEVW